MRSPQKVSSFEASQTSTVTVSKSCSLAQSFRVLRLNMLYEEAGCSQLRLTRVQSAGPPGPVSQKDVRQSASS